MTRKDLVPLLLIAFVAAIISYFVSSAVFKPIDHTDKAPQVQAIKSDFPDVKNDTAYSAIFYNGAVDATQPVQIGNSNNSQPFNGQ
ncbi:MAG TPA: hypothetical protein VFB03_02770 [Candidatus Saccharimonadales bacterium]|nr:hypothetical protein [Candidatus Saccharimonadales bacterium]